MGIGLQMLSNLLMLGPIFVTTFKVRGKHLTLRDNIGTFAKEDEAFDLLTRMSWQLPIFFIASAIVDLVLAFVYLKWLHPWKIILQEEPENWGPGCEKDSVLKKGEQNEEIQMTTITKQSTSVQEQDQDEIQMTTSPNNLVPSQGTITAFTSEA